MVHVFKQTQFLPVDIKTAWNFFSTPENLNDITPPELRFQILTKLPPKAYTGLMIAYKVQVFKGVVVDWLTEITHVDEHHFFVDEQRKGPYRIWHHEHHFVEVAGGVEMTDIVHYMLPFGWFGNLFHGLIVKPKLDKIFSYRVDAVNALFGKGKQKVRQTAQVVD
jgi:ligand-binding SRPBCC domain-containing protein